MLVKLRRNGAFELYDDTVDKFVKIITKQHLFKYMMLPIRLEKGLTLGEAVFAAPDQIWDVMPWDFSGHLKEMQKPYVLRDEEDELAYLEIHQTIIIDDGEDFEPTRKGKFKVVMPNGEPIEKVFKDLPPLTKDDMKSVEVYTTFHGISKPKTKDEPNGAWTVGDVIPYGIGLSPCNELSGLPLTIRHRNESHSCINKERKVVVSAEEFSFNPTILDFYYAIVYELTWYGPPATRDETVQDLRDRVDEIKKERGDEDETDRSDEAEEGTAGEG